VGTIEPVEEIRRIVKLKNSPALIHIDAVQAFGKLPLNVRKLGADLVTVSSHKIHGPKGCGALYVRRGVRVLPRQIGGGQEKGLRSGTEAVPAIVGFGAAAAAVVPFEKQREHYEALKRVLCEELSRLDGVRLHLPQGGVPYIVHLSLPGLRSETVLHYLEEKDIYVSSGSACSKGKHSAVLTAMELPNDEIDSSLRISFCYGNTEDEVRRLTEAIAEAMSTLQRRRS
jgi:cysteine desulfurase